MCRRPDRQANFVLPLLFVSSYVVRHVENYFQRSLLTQQQQQQKQKQEQDLSAKYLLTLTLFPIELSLNGSSFNRNKCCS
jgi:hypothetical protein